jgi:hypothetical protein
LIDFLHLGGGLERMVEGIVERVVERIIVECMEVNAFSVFD